MANRTQRRTICGKAHPNTKLWGGMVCTLIVDKNGEHPGRDHTNRNGGEVRWPVEQTGTGLLLDHLTSEEVQEALSNRPSRPATGGADG